MTTTTIHTYYVDLPPRLGGSVLVSSTWDGVNEAPHVIALHNNNDGERELPVKFTLRTDDDSVVTWDEYREAWSDAYWSAREEGISSGGAYAQAEEATEDMLDRLEER